jgi:hypothetical protein
MQHRPPAETALDLDTPRGNLRAGLWPFGTPYLQAGLYDIESTAVQSTSRTEWPRKGELVVRQPHQDVDFGLAISRVLLPEDLETRLEKDKPPKP